MNLNTLAFRNLFRRKRRTLITASSIAFGVMLSVTFTGSGDYTYTNMIDMGAKMGMGHVTIEPVGYLEKPTLEKKVPHTDAILQQLNNSSLVASAIPRIMGQAMFASAHKSVGGAFIAIDPSLETAENNVFLQSLVEGNNFQHSQDKGIIVGTKLAEKLKLKLGKKLVYTTTDSKGEIISHIARVSGIFSSGIENIDASLVLLPIATMQKNLGYQSNEATLIAIMIHDQRFARDVRDVIAQFNSTKGNAVLSWHDAQPDLGGVIAMEKAGNYIMQILIGLLIGAGILNTVLMGVLERQREFGMMMAVGMSPSALFRLVMVECFWLAIIGLIFGIIITSPWFYFLYHTGIDMSADLGNGFSYGGVLVDPVFKARLFPESIVYIITSVFTLTLVAGAYPAWKAGATPPIESLKTS